MTASLVVLSIPNGNYFRHLVPAHALGFRVADVVVGSGMGIGKASVYKYIPNYFPNDVGARRRPGRPARRPGRFFLPPLFGALGRWTGVPQMALPVPPGPDRGKPGVAAPGRAAIRALNGLQLER